ncbi:XRE family transcriptional regulator [Turicibacter sanguinis]|nr:XRE family transcriptional regulator [Turicibacter sanguinis]
MVYKNLKAEMARNNVTNEMLANSLGINISTVSVKLNNISRLKFIEAKKIQKDFFPNLPTDYLFDAEC